MVADLHGAVGEEHPAGGAVEDPYFVSERGGHGWRMSILLRRYICTRSPPRSAQWGTSKNGISIFSTGAD